MSPAAVVLLAILVFLTCAHLGGGLYECLVLDPVWPKRPAIVQPQNGGMSRRRFWLPAHAALEVTLVIAVIVGWSHPEVRAALLVAVVSHAAMRVWSFVDLTPKAVALEKSDPATIDRTAAERWSRRSLLRLPLDAITCAATLVALIAVT